MSDYIPPPTSLNGLTITPTTGTLTIANGKTLTWNNTLTMAGTDGSTLNIGTGGTLDSAAFQPASAFTYTGTANQVIVTGTVLSLPQSIGTTNSPTFASPIVTSLSLGATTPGIISGASGAITLTAAGTNQSITITSSGTAPTFLGDATGLSIVGAKNWAISTTTNQDAMRVFSSSAAYVSDIQGIRTRTVTGTGFNFLTCASGANADGSGGTNVVQIRGDGAFIKPGLTIPLISTNSAITTGAGALIGTLTNSPVTGNPTKWAPFNDNGTTRYVPMW